jgi:hypothetical protein
MSVIHEIESLIGSESTRLLIQHFGGQQIYIPKKELKPDRDIRILTIFSQSIKSGTTCMNAYENAAQEAGLSIRRVQQIVAAS